MLAFPSMLLSAAEKAGIKVPVLGLEDTFDTNEYPHFQVFCNAQLVRPMSSPGQHWYNAEVIAKIPDDKIKTVTMKDLEELGFDFS